MESLPWDKPDEIVEMILHLDWRVNVANAKIAELETRLENLKPSDFDPYDPA